MKVNRAQQKEKTRRMIIDAAFRLLGQERSYSSLSLREVAREAGIAANSFYRHFETFMEYIYNNPHVFHLLLRERSGTSLAYRKAVSRELQYFIMELADYIQLNQGYPIADAKVQAEAMVILVFNAGAEALDCKPAELRPLTEKAITQLRYVAKGADEFLKRHRIGIDR